MTQVSLVPILLWVAALAAAGIAVWRGPRPIARDFVIDRLLRYVFVSSPQKGTTAFEVNALGLGSMLHEVRKTATCSR
jgi:hypothetical protein